MARKSKFTEDLRKMLDAVWEANKEIGRIGRLLEVVRSRAEKTTTSFSDVPGGGHDPDSRSKTYDKLIDTEREMNAAVRDWCDAIAEVQTVLAWVEDGTERLVLEYRYINCEDWLTISFQLNYSPQHLYRIHGIALYKLAKKLKLKKDERK